MIAIVKIRKNILSRASANIVQYFWSLLSCPFFFNISVVTSESHTSSASFQQVIFVQTHCTNYKEQMSTTSDWESMFRLFVQEDGESGRVHASLCGDHISWTFLGDLRPEY